MSDQCRDFFEELDLIRDAYKSLEAIVAASDVEASHLFPIIYQLNLRFDQVLKSGGDRLAGTKRPPTLVAIES